MAFNLSEALGYDKVLSNLDKHEVVLIHWTQLKENKKNFFSVDNVQDLKDSMEMQGILQPLLVVQDEKNGYRVVAGHRRLAAAKALVSEGKNEFKEIPCVILPQMSEAMEWAVLIQTNTAARDLTHYEKAEAAIRMKKQLVTLKEQGVKIPGSLRAIVAEQLELNKTEIGRMEVIDKNLHEDFRPLWKDGAIDASCAYALAKLPTGDQKQLLDQMTRNGCRMSKAIVDQFELEKACADWYCRDCPYPADEKDREKRSAGWKFTCQHLKTLQAQHWATDGKCTCCADCEKAARCLSACGGAKTAALTKAREKKLREEAQKEAVLRRASEEAFDHSLLAGIRDQLLKAIEATGMNYDDVCEACDCFFEENLSYADDFVIPYGVIRDMAEARVAEDFPVDFSLVIALCYVLDVSPSVLLDYGNSEPCWHAYPDELPANGQRVVVRRVAGKLVRCGEYVYRDGEWYEPGLDDFKMNITGVTHWIECPEV